MPQKLETVLKNVDTLGNDVNPTLWLPTKIR